MICGTLGMRSSYATHTLAHTQSTLGTRCSYADIRCSYASHTQSTLAIRWHTLLIRQPYAEYAGHTLFIHCHLLTFAVHTLAIRWPYATRTLLVGYIRYVYAQFCSFKGFLCVWKLYYECSYATHTFLSYARVWQRHHQLNDLCVTGHLCIQWTVMQV